MLPEGCLDLVSDKFPSMTWLADELTPAAANVNMARCPVLMLTSAGSLSGSSGWNCQLQICLGPFQIYHVDTTAFLSVKMPFRLEIKVGATNVGPCSKEFENILVHLQGVEGSGLCVSFPLSYDGSQQQCCMTPLW